MSTIRPVAHDDRLSIVEHLDELRTRIIICLAALIVTFFGAFWQKDLVLETLNKPLVETTGISGIDASGGRIEETARAQSQLRRALTSVATSLDALGGASDLPAAERRRLDESLASLRDAVDTIPRAPPDRQPVTLGVGEPFFTTLTVTAYAAVLLALPVLLFQFYAFILPAFTPEEKRAALPLMWLIPFLFVGGVVFGYVFVLPPAVRFLQTFNDESFDILVQAKDYYRFAIIGLGGMGLGFQMPVAVLALTRLNVVTPAQLRKNRRYAILVIAVVAAIATPSIDPVTMLITMVPLIVLFELSILLASVADRRARRREEARAREALAEPDEPDDPAPDLEDDRVLAAPADQDRDPPT